MNIVVVSQEYILFIRNFAETEKHKHDTCHLTISLSGKMHCKIEDEIKDCYGYILNSNVYHQRFGNNADSMKMIFAFEPCAGALLSAKSKILEHKNYIEITTQQYEKIIEVSKDIVALINEDTDFELYLKRHSNALKDVIDKILNICEIREEEDFNIDERVAYLIKRIRLEETAENKIIDEVCDKIGLSKSRLLHLFKKSTGISVKRYMQYTKFFKTWQYLAQGENITQACIHAGYSDSAHYSNFMKQCYGLSTKKELIFISGVYLLK